MSGWWSRRTAAMVRASPVSRARWSRLMSTPSPFPRVLAARPSGFAVGITRTEAVLSSRSTAGSSLSARSRTVVRQASRPEGSLPCWRQSRRTDTRPWVPPRPASGTGSPMRTRRIGRPCSVVARTSSSARSLVATTVSRKAVSSSRVVHRSPPDSSKPVRGVPSTPVSPPVSWAAAGLTPARARVAATATVALRERTWVLRVGIRTMCSPLRDRALGRSRSKATKPRGSGQDLTRTTRCA